MWGQIAAAGISALGSWMGGRQANIARRKEARRNRNFQERMRDTAWQATVADMEKAGINPAVAYSQGPASSPGGSMAQQADELSPAISSAMQAKRLNKELKLLDQQVAATAAQAQKTQSEKLYQERLNQAWGTWRQTPRGREWIPGPMWQKMEAETLTAQNVSELRRLEIPTMENLASIASTAPGKWAAWLKYILSSIRR